MQQVAGAGLHQLVPLLCQRLEALLQRALALSGSGHQRPQVLDAVRGVAQLALLQILRAGRGAQGKPYERDPDFMGYENRRTRESAIYWPNKVVIGLFALLDGPSKGVRRF